MISHLNCRRAEAGEESSGRLSADVILNSSLPRSSIFKVRVVVILVTPGGKKSKDTMPTCEWKRQEWMKNGE